jgi:amino acid transporter
MSETDGKLGFRGAISIALGGMIGGGIYAVLGVVAGLTGPATWAAFVVAGAVALCAAYSYNALNELTDERRGGSVTFVQSFLGNSTLAGMTGWTLLVGYVGSMAMYAFAFAEFTLSLGPLPATVAGLPARPLVSVLAVAAFVGLNLLGAQATGSAETVLVAAKVAILLAFGLLGLVYATGSGGPTVSFGLGRLTGVGPVVAAAISFVAFQGWQLLFYDQERIADPVDTIRKAVYVSIPAAVVVYVLVGLVTVTIAPAAIESHPHVALKTAAEAMMAPYGLASLGGVVLAPSALFSTGSAVNATLFSAAHFAKGMLAEDLLPDSIGDSDTDGVPTRTLLVLGGLTAAFSAYGSLGAITSFASLSFIVVFGGVSYIALRQRDRDGVSPLPPAIGFVGSLAFLPLMLWNLYSREPGTFYMVLLIAAAVVAVETVYFEREEIEETVDHLESELR